MNSQLEPPRKGPQETFEPYAQLIRSLLPRASTITVFDHRGDLVWASETTVGPDLFRLVAEALTVATVEKDSAGQLRQLPDSGPTYVFWLRNEQGKLALLVAVSCRRIGATEQQSFSFVHGLVRPALEVLLRDWLHRISLKRLRESLSSRDKDLELLLAVSGDKDDLGADDLKSLLKNATSHLKCALSAIIVPEKGLVQVYADPQRNADTGVVAKTHRQLITLTHACRTASLRAPFAKRAVARWACWRSIGTKTVPSSLSETRILPTC
jgi:hypothetical protein